MLHIYGCWKIQGKQEFLNAMSKKDLAKRKWYSQHLDGEGNQCQNLRFAQVLTCAAFLQLELTGPSPSLSLFLPLWHTRTRRCSFRKKKRYLLKFYFCARGCFVLCTHSVNGVQSRVSNVLKLEI